MQSFDRVEIVWAKLAWREFWRPFLLWGQSAPGGRDFVWLSLLLALVLGLALLLVGTQEGLLDRFADVLLGTQPDYGVPIWVTRDIVNRGIIDTPVLTKVRALGTQSPSNTSPPVPGLTIHPYRELEELDLVQLPGSGLWKQRSEADPPFYGWAVSSSDPLWHIEYHSSHTATNVALPLEVVLNRSLFEKQFDYTEYRNTLINSLPAVWHDDLPVTLPAVSHLKVLWLQVGVQNEFIRFTIRWVTRLPTMRPVVFLFPLPTYHALQAAKHFPHLRYFPEASEQGNRRLKRLILPNIYPEKQVQQLAVCTGGEVIRERGDRVLSFAMPRRVDWVRACAQQYDIAPSREEWVVGDRISLTPEGHLMLPCHRMPEEIAGKCNSASPDLVPWDPTTRGNGFRFAFIYVPDRTMLSVAREALATITVEGKSVLYLAPAYQNAIARFDFLSNMLTILRPPYVWLLGGFLGLLLWIQIGTVIDHRRQRYGLFLAKGMRWWQIYAMLYLQMFLATILGLILAICLVWRVQVYLQGQVDYVVKRFQESLSVSSLDLLPLHLLATPLWVGLVVLGATWMVVTVLLRFIPLWRQTSPSALLHE